jgi:hypothetical protein
VDQNVTGYRLEIFLKSFKINCCLLDNEMPVSTNNHFANSFIKGNFQICISNKTFENPSPNFVDKIIEGSPIPVSVIYFDFMDANLLNEHCFRMNIRSIHHLLSFDNKKNFSTIYNNLDQRITFQEYDYNKDQVAHLRYRCEDVFHTTKKSDIKKAKTKKINQELLHSKDMEKYFEANPEERLNIISAIKENNYYTIKASATYLPSYLIHQQSKDNKIEQVIFKFTN